MSVDRPFLIKFLRTFVSTILIKTCLIQMELKDTHLEQGIGMFIIFESAMCECVKNDKKVLNLLNV